MRGLMSRIFAVAAVVATLFLGGCNFGADNAGDVYGTNQPAQNSSEHFIPESQKSGTVTGEPGPETSR
jgi:outer membrane lipoprotein SlyB